MKCLSIAMLLPLYLFAQQPGSVYSYIHTVDIASKRIETVWEGAAHYEAPNWYKDGSYLIVNRDGRLYQFSLGSRTFNPIPSGEADHCNNDHGVSPDGKWLALSHNATVSSSSGKEERSSVIYVMPVNGGTPKRITPNHPSYWHGWSADGKQVAYCALRNGDYDVYTIAVNGGEEKRLTTAKGLDDGPEYSHDGKYIYYNSYSDGSMEIWRMDADGSNKQQITNDQYSNWFAHPSPDGKWIVLLSYIEDQKEQHPFGRNVKLRLMNLQSGALSDLTDVFYGGQGTINVPSWSPDSKQLAFVSYKRPEDDQRLIIMTSDGLRWQDVFKGMDPEIASDKRFSQGDSSGIFSKYYEESINGRRQRLMPFFWATIQQQGQLHGNRTVGSKVNNANPYWFSYPGYSEILTGHVDTLINTNDYPPNPHVTILEYFNRLPAYKGKVAAFGAWDAFDRIINEQRSGIPVINAFDDNRAASSSPEMRLLNEMVRTSFRPWGDVECLDVFTHFQAMTYLKQERPKVLYVSYGETDEFAHHAEYKHYLNAAHQFDEWVGEVWNWVQSQPDYRDKTTLLITTDHGRGDLIKSEWTDHGNKVTDASQMWFALMGPKVKALGEITADQQSYQQQLAQTVARLMGHVYSAAHLIAPAIPIVTK